VIQEFEEDEVTLAIKLVPGEEEKIELTVNLKDEKRTPLKGVKVSLEVSGEGVGVGISDNDGIFKISLSPDLEGRTINYKAELAGFVLASGAVLLKRETYHEITMKKITMKKPPAQPSNRKWLKIAALVAGIAIVILAVMIIWPTIKPEKPEIKYFEASPSKISAGESSTLRWSVSLDATSRTIDHKIGSVASAGREVVSPTKTTTYTLTATNEAGKRSDSVKVIVGPGVTEIDRRETEIDRILGTVTYRGTPVEDIPIVLIASSECDVTKVDQRTYTDAQGRYFFLGISPGSYRIAINGWGGTDDTVEPYEHTCTWELEKKASSALTLDWSLHKTDLQITFPIEDTSIDSTSPTFRWEAYPYATRYQIGLSQVSPSRETIERGTFTESTRFTLESPLTPGARYRLKVYAWDSTGQIASGSVYFSVK
jgi:hypothetical protein